MKSRKQDTAATGQAIYREKILPLLKETDQGRVVVIDVNSGEWEIDSDDATAFSRILERCPNAYTWAERVGCPAVYEMGFRYTYPDFEPDLWEMDPAEFGL